MGDGTQAALLRGATFEVRQDGSGGGMTDLILRGADFGACRVGRPAARAGRAAHARRRRSPRRSGRQVLLRAGERHLARAVRR